MRDNLANLYIPQVEVFWGDVELTRYPLAASVGAGPSDQYESIVYDISVSLQESGQTPSGRMKWNPSGAGFNALASILGNESKREAPIIVTFYYYLYKSVSFKFVFSGLSENYGNDMNLEVKLASELDGLITANIKNVSQTDEAGIEMLTAIEKLKTFFGIDGISPNIVTYSPQVVEDLKKVKVQANYSESTSFVQSLENLVEQNGNLVFYSNIAESRCVVFPPYSIEENSSVASPSPTLVNPDPATRYGYFLGPSIIDSIMKTSEWQPNQKTQYYVTGKRPKLQPGVSSSSGQNPSTIPPTNQLNSASAAARTSGASGSSGSASRPGSRLANNEKGEKKKIAMNEERVSKLSASMFLCPALVGIKPQDIIFIPNLAGDFMEDWIVNSVEYQQTDGGVELSIQASRKYGWGKLMNPAGDLWFSVAKDMNIVGSNASINNWTAYAWSLPASTSSSSSTPVEQSLPPSPPPPQSQAKTVPRSMYQISGDRAVILDYGFALFVRQNTPNSGDGVVSVPLDRLEEWWRIYLRSYS